jgi:hypothetical protein
VDGQQGGLTVEVPPPDQVALPKVFWIYIGAAGLLACGMLEYPLLAYHFESAKIASPMSRLNIGLG